MSIGVAVFILINSIKNLKETLDLFLEKIPHDIDIEAIREHILEIDGVYDVHHIHIRSIDGTRNYATMHIVSNEDTHQIKEKVREELKEHGIIHATLALETPDECCDEKDCFVNFEDAGHHHHHHHH